MGGTSGERLAESLGGGLSIGSAAGAGGGFGFGGGGGGRANMGDAFGGVGASPPTRACHFSYGANSSLGSRCWHTTRMRAETGGGGGETPPSPPPERRHIGEASEGVIFTRAADGCARSKAAVQSSGETAWRLSTRRTSSEVTTAASRGWRRGCGTRIVHAHGSNSLTCGRRFVGEHSS